MPLQGFIYLIYEELINQPDTVKKFIYHPSTFQMYCQNNLFAAISFSLIPA
jgi:hypothetical protein